MTGRAGGNVENPALPAFSHAGYDELREVHRCGDLNLVHQLETARGEVLDPSEVGDRGIADQDVWRAELAGRLSYQQFPVGRP